MSDQKRLMDYPQMLAADARDWAAIYRGYRKILEMAKKDLSPERYEEVKRLIETILGREQYRYARLLLKCRGGFLPAWKRNPELILPVKDICE